MSRNMCFFYSLLVFYGDIICIEFIFWKCTIQVVFSIFTVLCSHHLNLILGHFHHPQKKSYILFLFDPSPTQPPIYFLSLDLPILDSPYEWDHTTCGLVCWLLLLNVQFSRSIHVVAWVWVFQFFHIITNISIFYFILL